MNTMYKSNKKMLKKMLIAAACSFALAGVSADANAGVGGSKGTIRSAINSDNGDAIVAALEQAEDIPCDSECMTMVMNLVDHDEYRVREAAAWWFARRPAQKRELAEAATAWLQLEDSVKARNGADVLGAFGYATYIPVLSQAAVKQSLSAEARAHAVHALGRIGNMAANETLATAMRDSSPLVRLEAVVAWRKMLKQKDAAPVAALVSDSDLAVRRAAISTVGTFRVASARLALEAVLTNDSDPAVRRNAAWSLGRIGDAASREVLRAATTDESSLVRMTAKVAMRSLR
jgi:HEAT repeat protein